MIVKKPGFQRSLDSLYFLQYWKDDYNNHPNSEGDVVQLVQQRVSPNGCNSNNNNSSSNSNNNSNTNKHTSTNATLLLGFNGSAIVSLLRECPLAQLKRLVLQLTSKLTDINLFLGQWIPQMPSLEVLYVDNYTIDGGIYPQLFGDIHQPTLEKIFRHCPKLHSFSLIVVDDILASWASLAPLMKNLQHLQLHIPQSFDTASLESLSLHCTRLISLDLSSDHSISSEGLERIGQRCPSLTHLLLKPSSTGCLTLFHCFPHLTYLDLTLPYSLQMGDEMLHLLAKHCPSLKVLKKIRGVSDQGIQALANSIRTLQVFVLSSSPSVTSRGIQPLLQNNPHLEVLQ